MDESKLLEECVSIKLTPLQTLLVSRTLIIVVKLMEFLQENQCIVVQKLKQDDSPSPPHQQIGDILLKSSLVELTNVQEKIWESGHKEIGEEIPEEFDEIMGLFSKALETIAYSFVEMLRERDK